MNFSTLIRWPQFSQIIQILHQPVLTCFKVFKYWNLKQNFSFSKRPLWAVTSRAPRILMRWPALQENQTIGQLCGCWGRSWWWMMMIFIMMMAIMITCQQKMHQFGESDHWQRPNNVEQWWSWKWWVHNFLRNWWQQNQGWSDCEPPRGSLAFHSAS